MKQFNNFGAKRSLGQNFLTDKNVAHKIVDAGDVHADDTVLEIGPGKGVLTSWLVALAGKVIAVEKDDALFEALRIAFADAIAQGRLDLIHGDILNFDPTVYHLPSTKWKLIANIPYNITGAILEKFLSSVAQPEQMVLLVQKEVAERVVARDHKESLLSISVKVYGTPKVVAKVSAGSFFPRPKVDSAVLVVDNISHSFFLKHDIEERSFFAFLHAGFAHKRKLLGSNLKEYFPSQELWLKAARACALNEKSRAENLSAENWRDLFLASLKHGSL